MHNIGFARRVSLHCQQITVIIYFPIRHLFRVAFNSLPFELFHYYFIVQADVCRSLNVLRTSMFGF